MACAKRFNVYKIVVFMGLSEVCIAKRACYSPTNQWVNEKHFDSEGRNRGPATTKTTRKTKITTITTTSSKSNSDQKTNATKLRSDLCIGLQFAT